MALLGKRVIHPGGRRSTQELIELAQFRPEHRVLEVGCGVGATAIEIAKRYGCEVVGVDIDPVMLAAAKAAVGKEGLGDRVRLKPADIQELPFQDDSFDRVIVEAVTIFADRPLAAREITRVCRPAGRVLDHEFVYRTPPTAEIRRTIEKEVCGGVHFDTDQDWVELFENAGLRNIQVRVGPFAMMTLEGMLRDEGLANTFRMMLRVCSRPAYVRKMCWLMARMLPAAPYLGYVVLAGTKP
jgi:cyclopropane fatty-acyl-phospholipid synthase-like methyltransferase